MIALQSRAMEEALRIREFCGSGLATYVGGADNLARGGLGYCWFLLELYRQTGDADVLAEINQGLVAAEACREGKRSNNQGLYYGRTGLPHLYLALFRETRHERYLRRCQVLTREPLQPGGYHFRDYDQKGLVKGIAGKLLHYLSLYEETREEWIYEELAWYVAALAGESHMAEQGVYWNNAGTVELAPTGWAHGGSGIALSLLELGRYFDNQFLVRMGHAALRYEDTYHVRVGNGDMSLGQGRVGRGLLRVYASARTGYEPGAELLKELLVLPAEQALHDHAHGMACDLLDGLAGQGLAFREAYALTGNKNYLVSAQRLAAVLAERLPVMMARPVVDGSLFHGLSGIGYFLLRMIGDDGGTSLLLPGVGARVAGGVGAGEAGVRAGFNTEHIREQVLKNNFRETCGLIKAGWPEEYGLMLQEEGLFSPESFGRRATGLSVDGLDAEMVMAMDQALRREMALVMFRSQSFGKVSEDNISFAGRMDEIWHLPEEELLGRELAISKEVLVLRREAPVDMGRPMTAAAVSELFISYGHDSWVYRINAFRNVEGSKLGMLLFYADLFQGPTAIGVAVDRVADDIMGQDHSVIALLARQFGTAEAGLLRERIRRAGMDAIKELLLAGVLEPVGMVRVAEPVSKT